MTRLLPIVPLILSACVVGGGDRTWRFDDAEAIRVELGNGSVHLARFPTGSRVVVRALPEAAAPVIELHHLLEGRAHALAARTPPPVYAALEPALHRWFGRWAARQLGRGPWDLVLAFSGVAEESLRRARRFGWPTLCGRGSAHIRAQRRLLAGEAAASLWWATWAPPARTVTGLRVTRLLLSTTPNVSWPTRPTPPSPLVP